MDENFAMCEKFRKFRKFSFGKLLYGNWLQAQAGDGGVVKQWTDHPGGGEVANCREPFSFRSSLSGEGEKQCANPDSLFLGSRP